MIAWTQPTTQEQVDYFSKHAKKRGTYMIVQTMLQLLHAAIAFGAWYMLAEASIGRFYSSPILFSAIAFSALAALHPLLKTTWATYWYDQLDDDPNTDSSVWIPLTIVALLLFTEYKGAQTFLESKVVAPIAINTDSIQQSTTGYRSTIEGFKHTEITDIDAAYAAQKAAVRATATAAANKVANKKDGWKKVRSINNDRDTRLAALDVELAAKKTAINDKYALRMEQQDTRATTLVAGADSHNQKQVEQYQSELNATKSYAWVISLALMGLILGLGYACVRINVKSGIIPQYHFTELDAHGGPLQRIFIALKDAINRQFMRLAVWIHKTLSPTRPLTDFDGTVMILPGNYNGAGHSPSIATAKKETPANNPEPQRDYRPFSLPSRNPQDIFQSISNQPGTETNKPNVQAISNINVSIPPSNVVEFLPQKKDDTGVELELPVLVDGKYMFKQSEVAFKQVRNEEGQVIGLEYFGPRMSEPTVLGYSHVVSRISTYNKAVGRAAETRQRMLLVWRFALTLFEVNADVTEFKTIYASMTKSDVQH